MSLLESREQRYIKAITIIIITITLTLNNVKLIKTEMKIC